MSVGARAVDANRLPGGSRGKTREARVLKIIPARIRGQSHVEGALVPRVLKIIPAMLRGNWKFSISEAALISRVLKIIPEKIRG